MRARFIRWLYRFLGKDPEPRIVVFASAPPALVRDLVLEIARLEPGRPLHLVCFAPPPAGFDALPAEIVECPRASFLPLAFTLRRRFRSFRIGLVPVPFTADPEFRSLRLAAFLLAPLRVLACNSRLERHHLSLSQPIASLLFLAGVPRDRIFLRPHWLTPWKRRPPLPEVPVREWIGRDTSPSRLPIAVLTPYFPFPLSHGGAVRIFSLLREMSLSFDVLLFSFTEGAEPDPAPLLEFCARVVAVEKPLYREPRWSTILPPEVLEYHSPAMAAALARLRRQFHIRAVQVEYTFLAPYGGDILVEHDVTFDLYRQIHLRRPSLSSWWNLWRWRRFELAAVRRFAHVVVMSEKDRALLNAPHATVIPNGVDLARFQPAPEPPGRHLLFIGSFRHFPNVVAFRFFFEQVWPALLGLLPDCQATVVAGPDPALFWSQAAPDAPFPAPPRTRILEFVSDVRPLYLDTNLVLVPTLVSAGTNVKVLEAMAMERAVLSTSSGCAGLDLIHGDSVWIADGAENFLDAAALLLRDPDLRLRLARSARLAAIARFGWDRIGERQRSLLDQVAGHPFVLRPAQPPDVPILSSIQATAPEAAQWQPEDYLRFDCHVADAAGQIAGFLVSRAVADREREILNVAVHPAFRRRGVATALILAEIARWPGDHFLEVRQSNASARSLYQKLGFRQIGVRPGYYDAPPEPGIVMRYFS